MNAAFHPRSAPLRCSDINDSVVPLRSLYHRLHIGSSLAQCRSQTGAEIEGRACVHLDNAISSQGTSALHSFPMTRRVVYRDRAIDLLYDILTSSRDYTLVLICSSRDDFLEQLAQSVLATPAVASTQPNGASTSLPDALIPTLQVLSQSRKIKLAFCANIEDLRCQMMTFATFASSIQQSRPLLQIVDLVGLHYGTSEFSVQGIMRTLASAIEGAAAAGTDLRLCECRDAFNAENHERGPKLWDTEVPLVRESARIGGDEETWSQTMVPVKAVASRWFKFVKVKRQGNISVNADEEMLVMRHDPKPKINV